MSIANFNVDSTSTPQNYATTLKMARTTGLGKEKFNENLGTGDGITDSYNTLQPNLIENSVLLRYGDSGSNDLTDLDPSEDYSIELDQGNILLTSKGVSKVNGKVIYIDYMYAVVSDTILSSYISSSTYQVNEDTGNYWGTPKTSIEYHDGRDDYRYQHTDRPYVDTSDTQDIIQLKNKSVQSITSVEYIYGYDSDGDLDTETLASTKYRFTELGEIILLNTDLPIGKQSVKVTYVHGYDEILEIIKELASLYAGVQALVAVSGGSYKDVSTYTLGRKSFSLGQIYINIDNTLKQFRVRIDALLNTVGRKMDVI